MKKDTNNNSQEVIQVVVSPPSNDSSVAVEDSENEENNEKNRFCEIIKKLCDSLISLAMSIRQPTNDMSIIIQDKNTRTVEFDKYIVTITDFNTTMYSVVDLLKKIIFSLNVLFVKRNLSTLTKFLEALKQFLKYLDEKDIFTRLNAIQNVLHDKYMKDKKFGEKILLMKNIIFKMVYLSLDITGIFVPQLNLAKDLIKLIEEEVDNKLV